MYRLCIRWIVALFALLPAVADAAAVLPGATIAVDGDSRFVDAVPVDTGGKTLYFVGDTSPIGFIGAVMDPDPMITAFFSIVDSAAPSAFDITWTLPIVPTPGPVRLTLGIGLTCSDADLDGCAAVPTLASGFMAEGQLDFTSHVFLGGAAIGPPGGSGGYPTLTTFVDLPAAVTYGTLSLHVAFLGSGGGDAYGMSGFVHVGPIAAVPAPPVLALVLGALGLAGVARRRR